MEELNKKYFLYMHVYIILRNKEEQYWKIL